MTTTTVEPFNRTIRIGTIDTGHATRAVLTVDVDYREDGRLSITGTAKRPRAGDIDAGGQMQDTIAELLDAEAIQLEPTTPPAAIRRLLELWERWHLNDMRPECEHQRADGWRELAAEPVTLYHWRLSTEARTTVRDALKAAEKQLRGGETVTLDPEAATIAALPDRVTTPAPDPPGPLYEPNGPRYADDHYNRAQEVKTRGWVKPSEHPDGLLTKPCPVCGYAYGSEWRREEVPAEVLEELRAL